MSIQPSVSWWYSWSLRRRPGALRLSPRTTASWCRVIRVMVWSLPPGRAARAPQASRQSNGADVTRGGAAAVGVGGGGAVATGFGVEGDGGLVAGPGSAPVLCEQAATVATTPTL